MEITAMSEPEWRVNRIFVDKIPEFIELCRQREKLYLKLAKAHEKYFKLVRQDEAIVHKMKKLEKPINSR